jgi:hypothetical protein
MKMAYKKKKYKHKRGPKKHHYKPRKPAGYIPPRQRPRKYHILTTSLGKTLHDIYNIYDEDIAYRKFHALIEERKNVVFPVKWIRRRRINHFLEADYELILIKKKDEDDKSDITSFRNQYGQFVDYKTDNDNWIILDKADYPVEETFWVYGYNPKRERKTFSFIFENFIEKDADSKYHIKNVVVYRNKLLIETTEELNMVTCKNHSDVVRMYNLIEEWCKERKYKYVMMGGEVTNSVHSDMWCNKIIKLTGWNKMKINRNSTRP